ncbi:MAG: DUF2914 domain-containing protein [bacterium]|nr:DUF2914 domain-containing protein [bacterium]
MKFKTYLLFLPVISIFIFSVYAEETSIDVSIPRAAVCTDIQGHEPVGNDVNFPETTEKLFFFTEIKSSKSGTIKHSWYYKNTKLDETELEYGAGQYRTWSYYRINPSQKGEWQVEATINDSTVIKRLVFTIGAKE